MPRRMLAVVSLLLAATTAAESWAEESSWATIRAMLFGERAIEDGSTRLTLEAPARAWDAAIVPVRIQLLPAQATPADPTRRLWLVIDNNPAPVAAVFHLAPEAGVTSLATRVRVNTYTPVHIIGESARGTLYAVERFVKASGGCSAPALNDPQAVMAGLGRKKL